MKPIKSLFPIGYTVLFLLLIGTAEAQDRQDYSSLEEKQNQIENLTVKVFKVYEKYPEFTYTYSYDSEGNVKDVAVNGIGETNALEEINGYLMTLIHLTKDIRNKSTRTNIYYATETLPKPKAGYRDLYDELYADITYPERVKESNLEGTVFVRFVVDEAGNMIFANGI